MGPLMIKTEYSILESTIKVKELFPILSKLNYNVAAVTDTNTMHATIEFIKEAKKHDIKPIIGLDVNVPALIRNR